MIPKNESSGHVEPHQAMATNVPPAEPIPPVAGKISAARAAVQRFLTSELGAREIRITKIVPFDQGSLGWSAEAEILVPNLEVKMLGLPLTQEVLERERYMVELETDLTVRSYGHLDPHDH